MLAIFCDIPWDIRHFNHVVGDKGWQCLHAEELIGFMERQVNAVNADAVEELPPCSSLIPVLLNPCGMFLIHRNFSLFVRFFPNSECTPLIVIYI